MRLFSSSHCLWLHNACFGQASKYTARRRLPHLRNLLASNVLQHFDHHRTIYLPTGPTCVDVLVEAVLEVEVVCQMFNAQSSKRAFGSEESGQIRVRSCKRQKSLTFSVAVLFDRTQHTNNIFCASACETLLDMQTAKLFTYIYIHDAVLLSRLSQMS